MRVTSPLQTSEVPKKVMQKISFQIKSLPTLSKLTYHHKNTYDVTITTLSGTVHDHDNFIDCGITDIIKSDEEDDLPLSELHYGELDEESLSHGGIIQGIKHKHRGNSSKEVNIEEYNNLYSNKDTNEKRLIVIKESIKKTSKRNGCKLNNSNNLIDIDSQNCKEIEAINKKKLKNIVSKKKKTKMKENEQNKYYNTKSMSAKEMQGIRERKKKDILSLNTTLKCESCIEMFKSLDDLETHNTNVHSEVRIGILIITIIIISTC